MAVGIVTPLYGFFGMDGNAQEPVLDVEPEAIGVLIVEDETLIALAASVALSELGHHVLDIAATAEAALRSAAAHRPDLVLMDITLRGGTDGIAAAELLKARFGLPVLFVTAHADQLTMERAAATDPLGYLLKPYSPQQLGEAVAAARRALRLRALSRAGRLCSLQAACAE